MRKKGDALKRLLNSLISLGKGSASFTRNRVLFVGFSQRPLPSCSIITRLPLASRAVHINFLDDEQCSLSPWAPTSLHDARLFLNTLPEHTYWSCSILQNRRGWCCLSNGLSTWTVLAPPLYVSSKLLSYHCNSEFPGMWSRWVEKLFHPIIL